MERKWSLDNDVFGAQLTVDEMVNAINVFEVLKKKYPNDDIIDKKYTDSIIHRAVV